MRLGINAKCVVATFQEDERFAVHDVQPVAESREDELCSFQVHTLQRPNILESFGKSWSQIGSVEKQRQEAMADGGAYKGIRILFGGRWPRAGGRAAAKGIPQ